MGTGTGGGLSGMGGMGGGIVSPVGPAVGADAWDVKRAPTVVPTPLLNAGVYQPGASVPGRAPGQAQPQAQPQAPAGKPSPFTRPGEILVALGEDPQRVLMAQELNKLSGEPLTDTIARIGHRPATAATPGGWSPTGKTEQRTGYWDPAAVEAQRERETTALAFGTVAGEEAATSKVKSSRDQAAALAADAGTSQEELDAWEKSLTAEQRALVDDLQGIAEQRVDPGRLFRDRGAAGSALSMLGDALSTFAEVRAGRPLSNRLAQDIDRDIALQTEEISRKGEERRNELAILRDQFGDLETAKNALRAKQEAALASRLTVLAAEAEEPAVRAGLEADASKMWADMQGRLEGLSQGTKSESVSSVYQQATGGSAGRYYIKDSKGMGKGPEVDPKNLETYGREMEGPDRMIGAIDSLVEKFPDALKVSPEGGIEDIGDIPATGMWDRFKPVKSDSDLEFEAAVDELTDVLAKAGGGVMTESDIERARDRIGRGSERERVAALTALRQAALRARTQVAQRFAPAVREEYELQRMPYEQRQTRELSEAKAGDHGGTPEAKRSSK